MRGLEGGHVAGGIPVTDGIAVLIGLVLGEEHAGLDLAGPGTAVLALAVPPRDRRRVTGLVAMLKNKDQDPGLNGLMIGI